jgi:predicted MFS family arabinose efflux permease
MTVTTTTTDRRRSELVEALRHRPYRLLVSARFVTMAGNALAPIALAFAVLDLTGSPTDLGLVVGARSVTNVALLLFGGVLADRVPRALVLVGSSTTAMASQAVVATLVLTSTANLGLLMALSAVNGATSAFAFPASAALVPQTVPAPLLQTANAVNRLGGNVAMIGGAVTGGAVVAAVGPGWGIAIDAAAFGVAAALYAAIKLPAVRRGEPARNPITDLREGWSEFVARSWVPTVVIGFCVFNAAEVAALTVLGPVLADETIGRRMWGVFLACETAGMVAGVLVAMRLRPRRPLLAGVVCTAGAAIWLFALALLPLPVVLLPAAFVTGVAMEQFAVAWDVALQENIPADRLARVYSYDAVGSFLAVPVGQVVAGPVATLVGPRPAILGAGVLVVLAVAGMLANPQVRTLRRREPAPGTMGP